ncbi:MAG: ATP-binding cassette domain-containing protein [Bacteroidales bacterium]|jgi:cell division transport system ATP-binding protein|nr:ATP-binding cassette domain-containing protein [Bacteroidales bacterium]MDD4384655.1 ATP-binding cassette domain-containing protein [Bacteroidales bacterium]MDY0197101.1 ATP-binding cassette domain-containing protein [Tenuifilaceae bacterium]
MALDTIIEFKKASIFQEDNLVLADVNLKVDKGEFIYLIGKVGSGKTSLIKTITAEIPLKKGEGRVVNFELHKLKNKQIPYLRRKIGIVFQDFQLLTDRTVNDNLTFVLKATGWKNKQEMKDRIDDVLDKVGLKHKDFKMTHQLSGGEQQRIVIARALLNNPDIILADEPTGNLDPETSDDIMKILFDIAATGRAVIMATHNYSLLKKFPSKTLRCEKTRLVETDHTSEIDFDSLME